MQSDMSRRDRHHGSWGLRLAPDHSVRGRVVEQRWRWPTVLALGATVPAFYADLLAPAPSLLASLAYALAALVIGAALVHTGRRSQQLADHVMANPLDLALVVGLLLAAALPASLGSTPALTVRLAVAALTSVRLIWAMQHLLTRGGLAHMLMIAAMLLVMCGFGYWWLEPTTPTLADGLWLAFVTAATVGYGDVVPTTPAARIFSFFVVLLGFGVLSLITAAVATRWVEAEERLIEREILRNVHRELDTLRKEIVELRRELAMARDSRTFMDQRDDRPAP